jgi:predicted NBD/HSP70 family sugar kinase
MDAIDYSKNYGGADLGVKTTRLVLVKENGEEIVLTAEKLEELVEASL